MIYKFEKLTDYIKEDKNLERPLWDHEKKFFNELEAQEGFDAMTSYFARQDIEEVKHQDLLTYIEDVDEGTEAAASLALLFARLEDDDPDTRTEANDQLKVYLSFLQKRNEVFRKAKEVREEIRPEKQKEIRPFETTHQILEYEPVEGYSAKKIFHAYVDGIKHGSALEKSVMIGATILGGWMLLRKVFENSESGRWTRALIMASGIALTVDAAVSAQRRRKQLPEKEWRAANHKDHIEQMRLDLKRHEAIPDTFLAEIQDHENYFYSIMNFSTMTSEEFENLYINYADTKQIPADAPGYPQAPFNAEDEQRAKITPSDRFRVMEDIAEALGFLDTNTRAFEIPEEKRGQSILYIALDLNKDQMRLLKEVKVETYLKFLENMKKDETTGVWEYGVSGTNYYFRFSGAGNWQWKHGESGSWHGIGTLPVNLPEGDHRLKTGQVGYPKVGLPLLSGYNETGLLDAKTAILNIRRMSR